MTDFTLDEAIAIAKRNDPGENVPSVSRVLLARIAELEEGLAHYQMAADMEATRGDRLLARIVELKRQLAEANGRADAHEKLAEGCFARLAEVKEDARLVYAAIPSLPITAETTIAATDALHQFCLAFNDFICDAARGEG